MDLEEVRTYIPLQVSGNPSSNLQADFSVGIKIGPKSSSALVGRLDLHAGWIGWVV